MAAQYARPLRRDCAPGSTHRKPSRYHGVSDEQPGATHLGEVLDVQFARRRFRTQVELVRKLLRWVHNAPPSSDCEVCSVSNRPIVRTTIPTITPEQDARRPLGLICVGTGRCGTKSITDMIGGLFRQAGAERIVMHEYCAREFYQAFCDYAETADARHFAEIRRMIDECPYDCLVG